MKNLLSQTEKETGGLCIAMGDYSPVCLFPGSYFSAASRLSSLHSPNSYLDLY